LKLPGGGGRFLLKDANRSLFPQKIFTKANEDSEDSKPFLLFGSFC
jgi:hypothetical protein